MKFDMRNWLVNVDTFEEIGLSYLNNIIVSIEMFKGRFRTIKTLKHL